MKKISQLLSALVFCSLMIFISCNPDDGDEGTVDDRDQQAELLIDGSPWTVTSATFDGTSRPDWEGATVSFSYNNDSDQGTYSVSGVPDEQPNVEDENLVLGSGTVNWSFPSETDVLTIQREGGPDMSLAFGQNQSTLTLSFQVTEAENRVSGFNGEWVFTFSAN